MTSTGRSFHSDHNSCKARYNPSRSAGLPKEIDAMNRNRLASIIIPSIVFACGLAVGITSYHPVAAATMLPAVIAKMPSFDLQADLTGYGCMDVFHRHKSSHQAIRVVGRNTTTYKVEYRLIPRTRPRTPTSWVPACTENLVSSCSNFQNASPQQANQWRYRTCGFWLSLFGSVEWRVTTTSHSGVNCITSAGVHSIAPEGGTTQVSIFSGNIVRDSNCANSNSPYLSSLTVLYENN